MALAGELPKIEGPHHGFTVGAVLTSDRFVVEGVLQLRELLRIPNFGRVSLAEFLEVLEKNGLVRQKNGDFFVASAGAADAHGK
jgi:hypothetical protein